MERNPARPVLMGLGAGQPLIKKFYKNKKRTLRSFGLFSITIPPYGIIDHMPPLSSF